MIKVLFSLILALPLAMQGATVFSDGFEANVQGTKLLPSDWTISNGGTVDIVGSDFGLPFHSGNNCLDLDGFTSLAAILANSFSATMEWNTA